MDLLGRMARTVARHFADPTYYARRFRAARLGGDPTAAPAVDRGWAWLAKRTAALLSALRSRLRQVEARRGAPSAFDRWITHPPVFAALVVLGFAAVMATRDTPRTAPLVRTFIPAGGAILAWAGAAGARAYVDQRWPRAKGPARLAWFVMGVIFVAITFTSFDRAVTLASMQIGVYSIIQAMLESLRGQEAS